MYTKTTFAIDGVEYTRLYLTGLPYYSKFDSQHVQTLDNVLTDLAQNGTESACIETVSTDDALEIYAKLWDKTIHYRFFFLYRNSRYQLYIVRPYQMNIRNGSVMRSLPSCKVLYKSDFSTIEMSLNTRWMNFYTAAILDEICLVENLAEVDEKAELKYKPSTTLITSEALYNAAVKEAQFLTESIGQLKPNEVKEALLQRGFWGYIQGKVCWEQNMSPQKGSLPSMYKAFASNKGVPVNDFMKYIAEKSSSDVSICERAISLAKEKFGNVALVALDWKQRGA